MKALKDLTREQMDLLQKHGWIAHHVRGVGSHTHGMWESFGHPDIEIALYIDPSIAHGLIWSTFALIKKQPIEAGKKYSRVVVGMDVTFIKSPTEENTLRLIIPDANGNSDFDTMQEPYKSQYKPISCRGSKDS